MLKKSKDYEIWFHVVNGKRIGIVARVPELLRLNLISTGRDFSIRDLNKWLYITESRGTYGIEEYDTFEDAEADLV